MIINNAPVNEAVLSNVGEIGEFRIRNSAKAFSILSSGLYANKVRAIVRELSCNAVDSHTAAGKQDTPFDVHLPNQLEPWFSIRDYGTGLSHEQVTQIYTTYFESTKTNSNEFIGALGLGSKSPFSYTDNFTVTAVQHGKKGIYTAFINEQGVPSIALMMQEETTDPSGVEVKFSVNDRYDYSKFRDEARQVYTYFKLRPVVSGSSDFRFSDIEYDTENIVPGVHSYKTASRSVAIMGNIAYPVEIPQADQSLGDLRQLLNGGLEMHFAIGELDFQASREGLSYIPQTIESIKRKLEAVNTQLAVHIAAEADKIANLWERAEFLVKKKDNGLWLAAINKYATDTKLPTLVTDRYGRTAIFKLEVGALASKYNIALKGIQRTRGSKTCTSLKTETDYNAKRDANGNLVHASVWSITADVNTHFVVNDTKIGATERAKFHYRQQEQKDVYTRSVFILEAADKNKPMNTKAFFKAIYNPPVANIFNASTLDKKERKDSGLGKNVTILCLQERGTGGYYAQREMVWRDAGKSDSFDDTETFYYLPLSGFEVKSAFGLSNVKEFYNDLKECGLDGIKQTVYGVRKSDIEVIKTKPNWVNLEEHLVTVLATPISNKLVMSLVLQAVDSFNLMQYNSNIVTHIAGNSPYVKVVSQFKGFEKIRYSEISLKRLCNRYAKGVTFSPEAQVQKFVDECATISKRYPLLAYLRSAPNTEVAAYVNLIDTQKGI